jgi:hypothetical protein
MHIEAQLIATGIVEGALLDVKTNRPSRTIPKELFQRLANPETFLSEGKMPTEAWETFPYPPDPRPI